MEVQVPPPLPRMHGCMGQSLLAACFIRWTAVIKSNDQVNMRLTPVTRSKKDIKRSSPAPFVFSDTKADHSNDCHTLHQSVINNNCTHNITTLVPVKGVQKQ